MYAWAIASPVKSLPYTRRKSDMQARMSTDSLPIKVLLHEAITFTETCETELSTTTNVFLLEVTKVAFHDLAINDNILAVEQNPEHTTRHSAIAGDVVPLVGGRTLDTHITLAHDALLAGVEDELELALDDDTVVDRDSSVEGRLDIGSEINHANDRAVVNVKAGLGLGGILDVNIAVELNGSLSGGVEDVGDGLLLAHDTVVVTAVGAQEDRPGLLVVAGDVADSFAKTRSREAVEDVAGTDGSFRRHFDVLGD